MKHVVENFNITAKTLRFYEEQGILPNVSRDEIGRRVYSEGHLDWISFIRCLRETGMSLAQIKEYKDLYGKGNLTFSQRQEMLVKHKIEVQKKIEDELKYLEELNYKIAMYDLQKDEVRKNPNHNFKCHGLENSDAN
ncbi:MerR family transcriptional regulator [Cohnella hashimotonis]|uniref:MerR family transcriptional regulator n=1 Tax=Cohnella hashimotonis TaxID=2826895 RepID=A0ABT6TE76_9BACL|nr:MerR family transcriptional regulator [Cohnella hashimotonis]MDI4645120.1 MerR family transcriptional regulator [Cohnella hashimotonis]